MEGRKGRGREGEKEGGKGKGRRERRQMKRITSSSALRED